MSTSWSPLVVVGQPSYSVISEVQVAWSPLVPVSTATGFGFGQGGFGQGGFGGGTTQSGIGIPSWTPLTID